jgi:hypothetical protein
MPQKSQTYGGDAMLILSFVHQFCPLQYDEPGYACWISEGTVKASDYVGILSTTLMDSLDYYGYNH